MCLPEREEMDRDRETLSREQMALLRQAAEWRAISLLFECPSGAWAGKLARLKGEVEDPVLKTALDAAPADATEGMYHSLFGPGGPVPAREVTYHRGVEAGQLHARIAAFYEAFAYGPQTPEAGDHIAVETGFIAYLKMKQAYALACGDSEKASLAAEAEGNFLRDHLAAFAAPLAEALEASGPPYLIGAGRALLARVR
jgi:nitrate reductase assembly molybdenum cofactor insertion protein NarJ